MFGFGKALDVLRDGDAVRRHRWAPHHSLILVPASMVDVRVDRPLGRALPELAAEPAEYSAHLDLVVDEGLSTGVVLVGPYALSSDDVLAEDWLVVDRGGHE